MYLEKSFPLVTVILPAFNAENYISRAIDSILSQSYKNIELIVIDDGSSDKTSLIVSGYKEELTFIQQVNTGVSAARNAGIQCANGELIAFIDADDIWYPEKLQIQVDVYMQHPDLSLIYTDVDKQEKFDGFISIDDDRMQLELVTFPDVFRMPYLKPSTVVIPLKVLNQVGLFDRNLPTAEDVDLFLRCAYYRPVIHIPLVLVYMEAVPGSLSDDLRSYTDNVEVIDRFCNGHPEFVRTNRKLVETVKSNIYAEYADDLCYRGYTARAISASLQSLKYQLNTRTFILMIKAIIKSMLGRFGVLS